MREAQCTEGIRAGQHNGRGSDIPQRFLPVRRGADRPIGQKRLNRRTGEGDPASIHRAVPRRLYIVFPPRIQPTFAWQLID